MLNDEFVKNRLRLRPVRLNQLRPTQTTISNHEMNPMIDHPAVADAVVVADVDVVMRLAKKRHAENVRAPL